MGYRESHSGSISGTVTVSYPKSESGGTKTVSWNETVNIHVHVDDDPFQDNIQDLKHHVDEVTACVVATEAAQVASKYAAANQIADSIINGFGGLIRSEIEQQMAEIKSMLPPRFVELQQYMVRFKNLSAQMEQDYQRISGRYQKLFSDLDKELRLRIGVLDKACFSLQDSTAKQLSSERAASPVITASLGASEHSDAQANLLSWTLRQRIRGMIKSAGNQIEASASLSKRLSGIRSGDESQSGPVYAPFLYMESDGNNMMEQKIMVPALGSARGILKDHSATLQEKMQGHTTWTQPTESEHKKMTTHINSKIVAGQFSPRVSAMIQQLWTEQKLSVSQGEQA
jgi:hypothetical protein